MIGLVESIGGVLRIALLYRASAHTLKRGLLTGCGKTMLVRENFDGPHVWRQQQNTPAGCSKRPSSKAAGDSKPEAYPQGYVEDFDEPRTKLAGFFSTLLSALEAGLQKRGSGLPSLCRRVGTIALHALFITKRMGGIEGRS